MLSHVRVPVLSMCLKSQKDLSSRYPNPKPSRAHAIEIEIVSEQALPWFFMDIIFLSLYDASRYSISAILRAAWIRPGSKYAFTRLIYMNRITHNACPTVSQKTYISLR